MPVVDPFVVVGSAGALTLDHTCRGTDLSPPLAWELDRLPAGTGYLSWVIDSPSGVSWLAWDAPAALGGVPARFPVAQAPPLQGRNHLGRVGWAGPCPAADAPEHLPRVVRLQVFATAEPLHAPPTLSADALRDRLQRVALGRATSLHDLDLSP